MREQRGETMAVNLKAKRLAREWTRTEIESIVQNAMRQVLREEINSVRVDTRGYLIFPNETEYAAYLKTQLDKLPSEIKAVYIDPQGFRVRYSDYEPTPKKSRELRERKKEPTVPAQAVWEELRKLGVA
jgi:predicted flavoprotein YhiN